MRKCPYCDFNSHTASPVLPEKEYVAAVLADLTNESSRVQGREVSSVFIGGGTPSLFSGESLQALLGGANQMLAVSDDCEITLEANPGTAEAERFIAYRSAGVNRLSLGIQSLHNPSLQLLGRIHSAEDARQSYVMAREAGFDNINLDMMFGLPQQDAAAALDDLQALISLRPEHISWYQLTLEPNTLFHRQVPAGMPDDDELAELHIQGSSLLAEAGYERYEVSAFSKPGRRCKHNLNYWRFGDYLAAGAGAHGKVSQADGLWRVWKQRHPRQYMADPDPTGERFLIEESQIPFEFMLNALRLVEGVDTELFEQVTGLPLSSIRARLESLRQRELILPETSGRIACTALGLNYLDDVLQAFLEPPSSA